MSWILPTLKIVLPHLSTIISAAKPAFTRKAPQGDTEQAALVQQQISELQGVAAQNATQIQALAVELERVAVALRRLTYIALAAAVLAGGALLVAFLK